MKILVPVKHVGALDADFDFASDTVVGQESLEWSINEWDEYAVEAATQLRDAVGGEVTVVTIGDHECGEGLVSSLARGVDRAIRVWDDTLEHAGPLPVARVLAAVIEREIPDLVLCGAQSSDLANAATGIAAAGFVGLPHIAVACSVEPIGDGSSLAVDRELEGGVVEHLRVALPALVSVQTGINEPGYVTLRALADAKERPVEILGLADLGLAGQRLPGVENAVRRLTARPPSDTVEMLPQDPVLAARRIAEIIGERATTEQGSPA